MIKRIIRKRTSQEISAWEKVRAMMPRGSRTRGIQYDTLEYLFMRLYEPVAENELADHLLEVRGKLQATGDPVKGAINQAIKELQRLPENLFTIVKIQERAHHGNLRYIKMNYTRYEEIINFQLFQEYITDILADESHLLIRCVGNRPEDGNPFPGLSFDCPNDSRLEVITDVPPNGDPANTQIHLMPHSPANYQFLLIYENLEAQDPFLGFIADMGTDRPAEEARFILYRGELKLTKLRFLHRLWHRLALSCTSTTTPA